MDLMNSIVILYLYQSVIIYLDDILICSDTESELVIYVRADLENLRENKIHAK